MNERRKLKAPKADFNSMMFGKVPPQATEIEEAVLGAIMLEKNALNEIYSMLRPEHFYKESHQIIYEAMQRLVRKNLPTDLLVVVEELKVMEKLDFVGGPYAVTKLTNAVVSSANIVTHTMVILQKFVSRELIRVGGETVTDAFEDATDVFKLLDNTTEKFSVINYELSNLGSAPLTTLAERYFTHRTNSITDVDSRIYTGFAEWDKINGPLFPGGVFFIAGRPGMGKTAYVVEMLKRMAKKYPVGFFNLEMTDNQIVQRLISNSQRIDNDLFKLDAEHAPDWLDKKITDGMEEFINLKLHIETKPGITIEGIKARAKYWKYKYGVRCLVIDFLQIIAISEERQKYHNDLENLNYIIAEIGMLAKELDLPIIVLSQLNRELYKRGGNKEPEISDMKGSGKIEEIAYQIAFLHRPEYFGIKEDEDGETTEQLAYFLIKKHRDGKLEKIKYKFEGEYSAFSSWDKPRFDAPYNFNNTDEPPF